MTLSTGSKIYFLPEVDLMIDRFQSASVYEKPLIYQQYIHQPMKKLCINVINTFSFYQSCEEDTNDLINECLSFIYQKLDKFDKHNGKAFSYFSVICKRYLIQKQNRIVRKTETISSISNIAEKEVYDLGIFSDINEEYIDHNKRIDKLISLIEDYKNQSKDNNEIQICNCIIQLFKEANLLEAFNKRSIYFLMREMTGLDTKIITKTVRNLKKIALSKFNEWQTNE